MIKKILILGGIVIALIGLFVGGKIYKAKVAQSKLPKVLGASTQSESLKIGLVPWVGDGLFYAAKEKAFFIQEKVNVEFVDVDNFATAKQLLQSGKVDAIYLTPETAVSLFDSGVNIKIVAANDLSFGADGIIASQEIKNVQDLKNKKVAFEVGSTSHFLLSYLLKQNNLSTKDLQVVENLAPDAGAAFVAGKVDAAVTWEPWLSKVSQRVGGHLLENSKNVPIIYDMLIFRQDSFVNKQNSVKAVLRALFSAQSWISQQKPVEVAQIISKPLGISEQEALSQMQGVKWLGYQENLALMTNEKYSLKDSLGAAGDLWFNLGLIKKPVNLQEIFDDSFLNSLYK